MSYDQYRTIYAQTAIAWGLTGYKYNGGPCNLTTPIHTTPNGCYVRVICAMGNPGFYIAQVEIIRKKTGDWVASSSYTKDRARYNGEMEMTKTIRIVLQILVKRGDLDKAVLELFDEDHKVDMPVVEDVQSMVDTYSRKGSAFSGAFDYLIYHTLFSNSVFMDGYCRYSDSDGSLSYQSGYDLEVTCNEDWCSWDYTMRAALDSYIMDKVVDESDESNDETNDEK